MCGIVGLFLKRPELEPQLGSLMSGMLAMMTDRGPDSAGFAVYSGGGGESLKFTVRGEDAAATAAAMAALGGAFPSATIAIKGTHAVISALRADEPALRQWVAHRDALDLVGVGRSMEIFKEVGRPAEVAAAFDLAGMRGTHGVGHTRMATESAVTTNGAHPFSTGLDQCLVHNGSLSNHFALRRKLVREGLSFETDNDSEVAAGYLTWRMNEGASLKQALEAGLRDLDGFFTFVVGTQSGFAVLRDPISCKPAVMAETDDYVAFGSEYRALTGLPGIERARVFEPEPAKVYAWERADARH